MLLPDRLLTGTRILLPTSHCRRDEEGRAEREEAEIVTSRGRPGELRYQARTASKRLVDLHERDIEVIG